MAEENDAASKTEEPTPRRLDEARRRGEVAKSADLSSWASLAGTTGAVAIAGGWMTRDFALRLLPFLEHPDAMPLQNGGAVAVANLAINAGAPILILVLVTGMVTGAAGNLVQHGLLWAPDKLKPDLAKLNPLSGLGRLFGLDGLVNFLKSILKISIVGGVAWWSVKPHLNEIEGLYALDPAAILPVTAKMLRDLVIAVVVVMGFGAIIDWMWQRQRFSARMRMSREEMKEEARQSDGDPHVKARQRQIRNERARRRMMQQVPKATVVVTNPTHYAVALRYVEGETEAPVCVAKGLDKLALRIRAVAEENQVPIVEDPPLARALYATMDVDESIPLQHYEAVAKVIGFVLGAAKRRRAR